MFKNKFCLFNILNGYTDYYNIIEEINNGFSFFFQRNHKNQKTV